MAPSVHLTVPADDGIELVELDLGEVGAGEMATVTTGGSSGVGLGLAGGTEGAATDDSFPLAIVVITVILIIAGVTAGILGFRSTRRKRDAESQPQAPVEDQRR